MAAKIKKGDRVVVIAGRNKGERGEVTEVRPSEARVVVQGLNLVKRHTKPRMGQEGGIVTKEQPMAISNVALLDPSDDKPTRVGFKTLEDGRKVRVARRSGQQLDA